MFPNPWATTSVPPPVVPKPIISYENNTQPYPFYAVPNTLQNMTVNQQNSVTLNAASVMTQALQSNGIDPTMVQKWQEWKQWELWQQQFQQWQQQTGQMTTVTTQPALPPNPPFQPSQPSTISFQNQQYPCNQPVPPLPLTIQPQVNIKNEGLKRGLEPELQNNEKKKKIDTVNNKKEIELNDETEALFEEQFKSWEEQFFKWKEQNKNHPDKTQYIEYEKKWLSWRDHLKQKCEVLKKKRELKMAEKKKEISQIEENVLQSQQRTNYNSLMSNVNTLTNESTLQHLPNSSIIQSTPENHIPGLDLISNNENINKGFLNVSRILPQNLNMPIQTPDDKPFNFPRNMNPVTLNPQPTNIAPSNINQPSTSMYQNSSSWSKYNNPISCYSQKPPDVENVSVTKFDQQIDINTRPPFSGETSNITYNNSQNTTNTNYRRPSDVSYITPSNETSNIYNKPTDDLSYNRNFNTLSNNFHGYNQSNTNSSNFNNFERPEEKSNISYQQSKPSLNTLPSKPPSLLSLNIVKPISLDKSGNYMENKNIAPNRYEKNWNIVDEEDDPENEYMEAHKKFSSEPLDNHNEDQFSDKQQHRNIYNESYYSRGQQNTRKLNEDYRSLNQSRGSQMMRNSNNDYIRPNSQFSRNINQNYPRDTQTSKNKEDEYYTSQNNRNMDQGFPRRASFSKDVNEEYSNETIIERDNFVQQKGNYGPPLRGNYESCRGNFGNMNKRNIEWDNDYTKNSGIQQSINVTADSPPIKKPVEASPIDPVKIFDYRHLPTLKVIPGLSKETVIPIKVYDYKHGGKRILPWQDRGFSRRNSKYPRDLNETEGSYQDKNDHIIKNNETLPKKLELSSNSMSSDKKDTNFIKNDINETNKETSITLDTITIIDDEDIEEKPQTIEIIDTCAPSPPMMSKIKEIEKSSNRQLLTIETLLCLPGRLNRPSKIVLILRGLPGSGKSYVAKLIKEKEVAMGGAAPRILSLDDYFMTEITKTEIDPETNKKVEKKVMEYEHDSANESLYRTSFVKAFKKKMLENYFSFYIIDAINNKVSYYKDIINISRMNGFAVYIVELEVDVDLCIKRNIHNRTAHDINSLMRSWNKTPVDQILLDIRSLLLSPSKSELNMEDISDVSDVEMELDKNEDIVDSSKLKEENENIEFEEEDVMKLLSCKWTDSIPQEEKMKRLDGLCKKKTENSIKEWLQIPEDNYTINDQVIVKDGKKRVRWADMEERREQEKMRAIGFVVGQTNWDRMLGRDQGESKLTQTKYI